MEVPSGSGCIVQPILLCHGEPLPSEDMSPQLLFSACKDTATDARDRCGHNQLGRKDHDEEINPDSAHVVGKSIVEVPEFGHGWPVDRVTCPNTCSIQLTKNAGQSSLSGLESHADSEHHLRSSGQDLSPECQFKQPTALTRKKLHLLHSQKIQPQLHQGVSLPPWLLGRGSGAPAGSAIPLLRRLR